MVTKPVMKLDKGKIRDFVDWFFFLYLCVTSQDINSYFVFLDNQILIMVIALSQLADI